MARNPIFGAKIQILQYLNFHDKIGKNAMMNFWRENSNVKEMRHFLWILNQDGHQNFDGLEWLDFLG